MVHAAMGFGGYRSASRPRTSIIGNLAVFAASAALGGAVAGFTLGHFGSMLPPFLRQALAVAFAVGAVSVGVLELRGKRILPRQIDRETPLFSGALRHVAAVTNGFSLGVGALSRIGFWLWYAVPFGALVVAQPVAGCIVYGTYGALRGISPAVVVAITAFRTTRGTNMYDEWSWRLIRREPVARRVAGATLAVIGLVVVAA